jgi:hypothetical protein
VQANNTFVSLDCSVAINSRPGWMSTLKVVTLDEGTRTVQHDADIATRDIAVEELAIAPERSARSAARQASAAAGAFEAEAVDRDSTLVCGHRGRRCVEIG